MITFDAEEVDAVEGMAIALLDIIKADKPGFNKPQALLESLNSGLYSTNRNAVARGADVRYTQAQRTLIRNLGNLVRDGLFQRDMAVTALKMQAVVDAEQAIDAYLESGGEEEDAS